MIKKRILCVSEASFLATGYSVYTKEILNGLWKTGKYEVAELARYCEMGDPRLKAPWIVYSNMPDRNNENDVNAYHSNLRNEFGLWRFNEIVLDFKPDYVLSFSDPWMDDFIGNSPLRNTFKWLWMATVDSAPQDDGWFEQFFNADGVFYYSDWGKEIVEKQGGPLLKSGPSTPPSVEADIFKPIQNKGAHRQSFGLDPNMFIVGTVMRNQRRKLFPDLMQSFSQYLEQCKQSNTDLYNRSYLYLHTTYPDLGWDIPELIKEYGIAHRTLITYRCTSCKHTSPSFYSGPRAFCPKCNNYTYGFPTTQEGVSRETLASVYNLFDVFVQYSIAEGFGIPQIEAAACGVPVMSVDYSAMSDVVRKLNGTPIKVERMFREAETNAYRAYPDNKDLIQKIYSFANQPFPMRQKKGFEAYKGFLKHYGWDKTVAKWIDFIESNTSEKGRPIVPGPFDISNPPQDTSHTEFLDWVYTKIMGRPDKIGSYTYLKTLKWINYGAKTECRGGLVLPDDSVVGGRQYWEQYDKNNCVNDFINDRKNTDYWLNRENGSIMIDRPLFIETAFNRTVKNGKPTSVNSL